MTREPHREFDGKQSLDGPEALGNRIRGHLVWGHESRSFTECDSGRNGWAVNESGDEIINVYKELASAPYQEMFVEVYGKWDTAPVEGFGGEYSESLRIRELIRAENEGFGCRRDLSGVHFLASGNEPFWHLEIRDEGITFSSLGDTTPLSFPPAEPGRNGGSLRIQSRGKDAEISVWLERQRCVDSMSGARYALATSVELRGKRYTGCAIEGNEAPREK